MGLSLDYLNCKEYKHGRADQGAWEDRTMRGRKIKTFYAKRGHLTASGASKSEAKAALELMIDWACNVSGPVVESRFDLIIVVAATANGYETTVFNPVDLKHGARHYCFTCQGQIDYGSALQSARMHAAQWAWSLAIDNDQNFVTAAQVGNKAGELISWIGFQRRYAAEKANGRNDADAFNLANGLPVAPLAKQEGAHQ